MTSPLASAIYAVTSLPGTDKLALAPVWERGDAAPAADLRLTALTVGDRTLIVGYDRASERVDVAAVGDREPYLTPVEHGLALPGGPWDALETFVLGDERYLMTYRADHGTFGFFRVRADLAASTPYTFALPRNTPTKAFTTVKPFTSLGGQYLLGYDFDDGTVAAFSLAVTTTSSGGAPPLLALNCWYHRWARGWTHFAFFQLGGANFFFKINTAKLNVNIDHIQDNPAAGTVEVGSYLQDQLPEALAVTMAQPVPWDHGEPLVLTYDAASGRTSILRVHADCKGWTRAADVVTRPGLAQVVPYRIGDATFVLVREGTIAPTPAPTQGGAA